MNENPNPGSSTRVKLSRAKSHRGFLREVAPAVMSRVHRHPALDHEKIQPLIDAIPSPTAVLDLSRTITAVNRKWRESFTKSGISLPSNGIGSKYPEIFEPTTALPDSVNVLREGLRRLLAGEKTSHEGVLRFRSFPDPVSIFVNLARFAMSQSGDRAVLATHDSIPTGKIASEVLRNTEQFLRSYFQTTKVLRWDAFGSDRRFTEVGEDASEFLGFLAGEWLEPSFWECHLHPEDRREAIETYAAALNNGSEDHQFRYRMIAKDGRIVWIYDIFRAIPESGKQTKCSGLMVDVTEQKRAEESVKRLTGRLISAQEEERKRIARELHDDLNQRVAVLSIELEQLSRSIPNRSSAVEKRFSHIQKEIEKIGTEIHIISHHLHPSKLDHLGLVPAIKSLCKEASGSQGLDVDFHFDDVPARLPKNLKLCMFRIAQEALQNALKHSGATKIDLRLVLSGNSLELLVIDNGSGFVATAEKLLNGLGLTSMEERLRSIDGELRIISSPGRGTVIEAVAPLPRVKIEPTKYLP
jgi:PAS domain S-box-containing protein